MNAFNLDEYVDEAKMIRHCAPVFFLPSLGAKPSEIVANGTIALVNTGETFLLVTCCHVLTEFHDYKRKTSSACLCTVFDGYVRHPVVLDETSPIDSDTSLDLTVFPAFPQMWPMGSKEFFRVERWPIPKPKVRSPIAFVGFPGKARVTTEEIGNFQYSAFGLTITSVSDRKFVIGGRGPGRGNLRDNDGNVVPPMLLGGMSGTPAYVRDMKAGFQLAGFVQMGNTSSDDLYFTQASVLNRDGTLKR